MTPAVTFAEVNRPAWLRFWFASMNQIKFDIFNLKSVIDKAAMAYSIWCHCPLPRLKGLLTKWSLVLLMQWGIILLSYLRTPSISPRHSELCVRASVCVCVHSVGACRRARYVSLSHAFAAVGWFVPFTCVTGGGHQWRVNVNQPQLSLPWRTITDMFILLLLLSCCGVTTGYLSCGYRWK